MTSKLTSRGHKHVEAFCLMTYACKECRHHEVIWNSRDGVTPFGMQCPSCGSFDLMHVEWENDIYSPVHLLNRDQRFWRDGTAAEAEALARQKIERMSHFDPMPREVAEKMIQEIRDGVSTNYPPGWPMLDRNDERSSTPKIKPLTWEVIDDGEASEVKVEKAISVIGYFEFDHDPDDGSIHLSFYEWGDKRDDLRTCDFSDRDRAIAFAQHMHESDVLELLGDV